MTNHVFTIRTTPTMGGLVFICSCGGWKGPVFPVADTDEIPLSRFTDLAHEHIEAAERARVEGPCSSGDESATARGQGEITRGEGPSDFSGTGDEAYRSTSAITSEDQLIDIETGLSKSDMTYYSD